MTTRQHPSAAQASLELIEAFKAAPTAIISDNLARLPGAVGLRPFHNGTPMAGTASRSALPLGTISRSTKRSRSSGLAMCSSLTEAVTPRVR